MRERYYILDSKRNAVPATLQQWASWFGEHPADRIVARWEPRAGIEVSTVFLGLDHNWGGGRPHLFETMIFGGPHDQVCWRCSTWKEAEEQHQMMLRWLRDREADARRHGKR